MGRNALTGPVTSYIAGELRAQRSRKRWTLDEIAARSGLPRSTVDRALKGDGALAVEILVPLCEAMDLGLSVLLAEAVKHR
jgi:transcriptional regulator with XRE-family HTH domain